MLVLKKNDPNVAILPDANRATLFIDNSARDILSIKQANGYIQLLTFHDSNLSGNLTMDGNIFVSNGQVVVNGNITGANLMGPLANGTSNVRIATTGGNVVATVAGNSTLTVSATGANIVGTANISGNTAIGGNLSVTGTSTLTGNVSMSTNANVTANLTSGNANVIGELLVGGNANVTTNLRVAGDATIVGNIVVQGNTTYINVENLNVEDPIISLGGGPNGAPLTTNDGKDRGSALQYYTTQPVTAFMGWDNGNAEFAMGANVSITNEVVTYNELGNLRALSFIGNLARGTSSVSIPVASGNVNINAAGNNTLVVTTTGANITGTSNVTGNAAFGANVTVVGNLTAANITGVFANGTSDISIPAANGNINFDVAGVSNVLVVTSTGANLTGTANISGNTDIGGNLVVTANITGANLQGPLANGTSNVRIPTVNGNVTVTVAGNTTLTVTGTGANVSGTANITGNTDIGGNLVVTANITGANLQGPLANGSSNVRIAAVNGNVTTTVAGNTTLTVSATGANVTGTANVTGNVAFGSNLTVTSNVTAANFVGVFANGTSDISIPASNGNINFDVGGVSNVMVVTSTGANVTGTANVTGNTAVGGNLSVSGNVTVTSTVNITSGQLATEAAVANVFTSANTTTLNVGLGATTMTLGATGSNANVRGNLNVVGFVVGNTAYYGNGTGGNFAIGYRDVPQIIGSANVTLGLTDAGKHIYANAAPAFTITIPTHANVAFPIGTAVSIVQAGANSITIAPQSGVTLRFAGNPASTGNRTVSTSGVAALIKVENNVWYISGSGVA